MIIWTIRVICVAWACYSLLQYPIVSADKSTRTIYHLKAEIKDSENLLPSQKAELLYALVNDSIEEFDRNNGYIDHKAKTLSSIGGLVGISLLILSFGTKKHNKSIKR